MDVRLGAGRISSHNWRSPDPKSRNSGYKFVPCCSGKGSPGRPEQNGSSSNNDDDKKKKKNSNGGGGDKLSTDWDKAWSNFRKQGKKTLFSDFSPDKYVSWNPRRSDYPLSEEVDPIKRTERSNLRAWNSPTFTLGGAIVIVTFLLIYTISALPSIK